MSVLKETLPVRRTKMTATQLGNLLENENKELLGAYFATGLTRSGFPASPSTLKENIEIYKNGNINLSTSLQVSQHEDRSYHNMATILQEATIFEATSPPVYTFYEEDVEFHEHFTNAPVRKVSLSQGTVGVDCNIFFEQPAMHKWEFSIGKKPFTLVRMISEMEYDIDEDTYQEPIVLHLLFGEHGNYGSLFASLRNTHLTAQDFEKILLLFAQANVTGKNLATYRYVYPEGVTCHYPVSSMLEVVAEWNDRTIMVRGNSSFSKISIPALRKKVTDVTLVYDIQKDSTGAVSLYMNLRGKQLIQLIMY